MGWKAGPSFEGRGLAFPAGKFGKTPWQKPGLRLNYVGYIIGRING